MLSFIGELRYIKLSSKKWRAKQEDKKTLVVKPLGDMNEREYYVKSEVGLLGVVDTL